VILLQAIIASPARCPQSRRSWNILRQPSECTEGVRYGRNAGQASDEAYQPMLSSSSARRPKGSSALPDGAGKLVHLTRRGSQARGLEAALHHNAFRVEGAEPGWTPFSLFAKSTTCSGNRWVVCGGRRRSHQK